MTNIYNDQNNTCFSNSYNFESATTMGTFARQISHNAGVNGINQINRNTLSVDCRSDAIMQDINNQYTKMINPE